MFENKGGNQNPEEGSPIQKKGIVKNKEVIAQYDEVLSKQNGKSGSYINKLDALKERLGLGGGADFSSEIKTNLIDNDDVATFIDWKANFNFFVGYSLVIIILVSGFWVYLSFLEKEEINKSNIYDESISVAKEGIKTEETLVDAGLEFQKKVGAIETLLDNHVYWTNFFQYLEKNTLKDVEIRNFSGELDGKFNLPSVARDKYFTASEQIKSFREDERTVSIDVPELTLGKDSAGEMITFDMSLVVDKGIFYKKE